MAYEADPRGVRRAATPTPTPSWPAGSLPPARRSAEVVLPDDELRRIAALCAAFDVDGMRADLVVARTAVAHAAAWQDGRASRPSRRRTSGWPPNWRCRTAVGATRSTIPGSTPTARRGAGAGRRAADPNPSPSPTPSRRAAAGRPARHRISAAPANGDPALAVGPRAQRAAPSATFRTRALVVPGVGEGHPAVGRGPATATGTTVSATDDPDAGHGAAPVRHAACRRGHQQRRRAASRSRPDDLRRAVREGPRRQSGDLRRRRLRVDGGARPDVRRQRRHAVAAARRLPAPRQGRRHHLPRAARRRAAAADVVGAHRGPPAGAVRHRRQDAAGARDCWRRGTWCMREKARDRARRSLVVVLTDGRATGGPDPLGRTRTRGTAARPRAPRRSWWTARRPTCDWVWPRSWPSQLGAPAVRLAELRADALDPLVKSRPTGAA